MLARTSLFAIAAVAVAALGCSGAAHSPHATDPNVGATESALDAENGGMTTEDTAPAFGDPNVEAIAPFDPTLADPEDMTTESASASGAKSFHIALFWGHLPPAHDAVDTDVAPQLVDWSGTVSVDQGAIGVKRTLAFDAGDKVDPRLSPNVVSFDSHTLPFVDGLFLRVVVAAGNAPVLHFKTTALTTDIDLSQLDAKAGGVTRLANPSDGLAYIGYGDVAGCARGLMYGRWVKVRAALGGFRGRVIDGEGDTIGHVRGIWGHAPRADKDVFFGKYISLTGAHEGLFGGTYGGGEALGVWATVSPKDVGALQVFYSDGYDQNDGRGVWLGRWSEMCQP
jgi:hypothetical protein